MPGYKKAKARSLNASRRALEERKKNEEVNEEEGWIVVQRGAGGNAEEGSEKFKGKEKRSMWGNSSGGRLVVEASGNRFVSLEDFREDTVDGKTGERAEVEEGMCI